MNSQSVYGLVALVRTRSDQQNSPTFSDTTELVPWVKDSLKQLYEILTSRWVEWYTVQRPLSLQANVERYSLPYDFRSMQAVYMQYNNGQYREMLQNFQKTDYGRYGYDNVWRQWPLLYKIIGNKILFTPRPAADYVNAIEFWYTPQWQGPILDYSPIDMNFPNGWEEWVVLDVMQKMKVKLGLDTTDILREKSEIQARVIAGAAIRDAEPPQQKDAYQYPRWTWYNGVPGGAPGWTSY